MPSNVFFKVVFTRMLFSDVPLATQGPRVMIELQKKNIWIWDFIPATS